MSSPQHKRILPSPRERSLTSPEYRNISQTRARLRRLKHWEETTDRLQNRTSRELDRQIELTRTELDSINTAARATTPRANFRYLRPSTSVPSIPTLLLLPAEEARLNSPCSNFRNPQSRTPVPSIPSVHLLPSEEARLTMSNTNFRNLHSCTPAEEGRLTTPNTNFQNPLSYTPTPTDTGRLTSPNLRTPQSRTPVPSIPSVHLLPAEEGRLTTPGSNFRYLKSCSPAEEGRLTTPDTEVRNLQYCTQVEEARFNTPNTSFRNLQSCTPAASSFSTGAGLLSAEEDQIMTRSSSSLDSVDSEKDYPHQLSDKWDEDLMEKLDSRTKRNLTKSRMLSRSLENISYRRAHSPLRDVGTPKFGENRIPVSDRSVQALQKAAILLRHTEHEAMVLSLISSVSLSPTPLRKCKRKC